MEHKVEQILNTAKATTKKIGNRFVLTFDDPELDVIVSYHHNKPMHMSVEKLNDNDDFDVLFDEPVRTRSYIGQLAFSRVRRAVKMLK